ncbi:ROK family transcriptional regulator [Fictibacillus terranigra]|uniref:ROK family transcriptional regulator n=1 Tax=Fictibacillus terranigra TaxID=3058424 RepID=A0ABT8E189_9BACL|nr:ROK family transcriptional regulator [Fictibacillus sp. CENA-BCM004]MDN4071636.1 ROK family transcriptional regulator [Fictibacillus sp. CENA-BCM004]
MQRGTFQLMKSLNRNIILNKIRLEGPISRAQIAKDTKLTPPTVSSIVKELIESNLIKESVQGESKGGRKPTMLVINADSFYVIGLDVGPKDIKTVMTDLNGKVLVFQERVLFSPLTNAELLDIMKAEIQQIMDQYKGEEDKIIGIGVGMHGVVDAEQGLSLYAPNLNLRNIPIKEELENRFSRTVKVENDAKALALGEVWFGNGNGAESVVVVNVGNGVGAGIVVDGKLFHGANFIAGEIGHMTIDIGGRQCTCGNYGCLQTLAAGPAIAEKAQKEVAIGRDSLLREMADHDLEKIDGKMVFEGALQGDELCIHVLKSTGIYLGIGLTNLIHLMNPKTIIIGGGVSNAGHFVMDSLKETVQKKVLTEAAKHTDIRLSMLGNKATAIGAVALLLVELFQ